MDSHFFAITMGSAGLSSLFFGRLYDLFGIGILPHIVALASFAAPLAFFDGFYLALLGMILWGFGIGAQESVMRAVIAEMILWINAEPLMVSLICGLESLGF